MQDSCSECFPRTSCILVVDDLFRLPLSPWPRFPDQNSHFNKIHHVFCMHTEIWQVPVYLIQADFIPGMTAISRAWFNLPQVHLCSSWDTAREAPISAWCRQGRQKKENSINQKTGDSSNDPRVPVFSEITLFTVTQHLRLLPVFWRLHPPPGKSISLFIIQSLRATYPAFLWESINANGFRANHTSQDGNHIHEWVVSFPDSFTLGKTIDRKFGKDVGERTSSPDVDKDFLFFWSVHQ